MFIEEIKSAIKWRGAIAFFKDHLVWKGQVFEEGTLEKAILKA